MAAHDFNGEITKLENEIKDSISVLNQIRDKLIHSVGLFFKDQILKCVEERTTDSSLDISQNPKVKALQQNAQTIIRDLFEERRFLKYTGTPSYRYSYKIEQELETEILDFASVPVGKLLSELGLIKNNDQLWHQSHRAKGLIKHINIDENIKWLTSQYAQQSFDLLESISKLKEYTQQATVQPPVNLWGDYDYTE